MAVKNTGLPVGDMVPIARSLELHVPPGVASENAYELPTHISGNPLIGAIPNEVYDSRNKAKVSSMFFIRCVF